jgi:N-acetyl-anhydromuramyl-L-alanine amidase AmpD
MTTLEVQKSLIAQGYKIQADGIMGPETETALRHFQTRQFVTGEADKRTVEMLAYLAKQKPAEVPALAKIAKQIPLQPNEYIQERTPKGAITLHLTAGSNSPHFTRDTWELDAMNGQTAVATHFIIAGKFDAFGSKSESGEIYQTFPIENWAYHVNWNPASNKNNVGIEICNAGMLVKRDKKYFAPALGREIPAEEVEEINFRGYQFWHRITDAQIEGLKTLLTALLAQYPEIKEAIQTQNFDASWSDYNDRVAQGGQKGIFTHTNFIPESARLRFDMPPFPRLLAMLNSLK